MAKAPEVAGLGQNGERIDGADARDRAREMIVGMVAEQLGGALFDGVALLDQTATMRQNEAEHPDGVRVRGDRKAYGSL